MGPNERLAKAREKAGYETAKDAAEAMGVPVSTYIQHGNGGRGINKTRAVRYARFFRVSPEWILYGRGDGPNPALLPSESDLVGMLEIAVRDIPVSATYADWPRYAAVGLRTLLVQFLSDRLASDQDAKSASQVRISTDLNARVN